MHHASYAVRRLASSADAPDQRSRISRHHTATISQQAPLVRQGSTKASLQCRRPYTAQRLVISASQQVPGTRRPVYSADAPCQLYCAEASQQCRCSRSEEPDQQAPYKQFRHEEVPGQSAGSLSDAGEHEGQSTVQTPLQRLASSTI